MTGDDLRAGAVLAIRAGEHDPDTVDRLVAKIMSVIVPGVTLVAGPDPGPYSVEVVDLRTGDVIHRKRYSRHGRRAEEYERSLRLALAKETEAEFRRRVGAGP